MKVALAGPIVLGMALGAWPPTARGAEDSAAGTGPAAALPAADEGDEDAALNLDLELASAYVWRGANVWGPNTGSQNLSLFPSATLTLGDLSAGYWGAYQLTGRNRRENVDAGVGAEQDLFVEGGVSLADNAALALLLVYYFYPLARSEEAGVSTPMYLEPVAGVTVEGIVEAGFRASYFRGLQRVTDEVSHVYLNPFVSKSFEVSEALTVVGSLGAGYKVLTHADAEASSGNRWDVQADLSLSFTASAFYVSPAIHGAWTDPAEGTRASEGVSYWAGSNVGYDISF